MVKEKLNIPVDVDDCFIEEFRMLRTRVELLCKEKKVIMITSMLPGEGKTTVALNLARSLASVGRRVIFVDCDLRNSKIVSTYKLEEIDVNIQSYLIGEKELDEVILKSKEENLDFIFSVGTALNSAELLESERFRIMLVELKGKYDFIIIDTPPMTRYADATIIAKETGAVILVIQENRVKKRIIREGLEQLKEANSEVLGVVFNKWNK
ncbi:MAG TPA: CpsD/CapB family tyrosine-protein kinase [Tissierellaceae bacterium]